MLAAIRSGAGRKQQVGWALLMLGGTAFFLQLLSIWLEAGGALESTAPETLGWMGSLGMAALQAVDFIAFHPNGLLLGVTRVLLLCWPVAVMIAGLTVSRKSN